MNTKRTPTGAAVIRPELTEAVIDAVLDELAIRGFGGLSMQRVADQAGVSKSALYRRWSGKRQMVMDVVARFGVADDSPPDKGSLTDDLRCLLIGMRDWLAHPRLAPIVVDLLAEARRSPELAAAFRTMLAEPRRAACHVVLERAGGRGETRDLGGSVDNLVVDIIASVPFWQLAIHGDSISEQQIDALAQFIVRAVSPEPDSRTSSQSNPA